MRDRLVLSVLQGRLVVRSIVLLGQFLDVAFVPGARRRSLVPDEVVETDKIHLYATISAPNDVGAGLLIGDPINLVDEVYARRNDAESQEVANGRKCFARQIPFAEAEREERLAKPRDVLLATLEEHVDVFREPRMPW